MLTVTDFNVEKIQNILARAQEFADGKLVKATSEVFVSNLFYEDSTRTRTSFDIAERKLGLQVVPFDITSSSVKKGESLYDTVKTLQSLGVQLAVIRHSQPRFYEELKDLHMPIINGGDGTGHHPSQSLLDLLTIYQEFGKFKGLKVGIVGDVKHSRVANSNAQVLRNMGAKVFFSGPEQWFDEGTIINGTYLGIDTLVQKVDVLMLLRIQHERHGEKLKISAQRYHKDFGLTLAREKQMQEKAIIMHPAPVNRGVEIDSSLVESPRSRIFKQMENGVFVRMAILEEALSGIGVKFKEQ